MTFQTMQTLIDLTRRFHALAARHALSFDRRSEQERLAALLNYLSKHEAKLTDILNDYQAPGNHVNTTFGALTSHDLERALNQLEKQSSPNIDDTLQLGIHIGNYLIWAYENVAQHAETAELRKALRTLCNLALTDRTHLSASTS